MHHWLCGVSGMVVGGAIASAAPIVWSSGVGANGHAYDVVVAAAPLSWTQANALAPLSTYGGMNGHLATLTSAEEDAFVLSLAVSRSGAWFIPADAGSYIGPWLGGYQDRTAADYSEPNGGWRWVTGEAWDYTNWLDGEPNNFDGVEDFLHYFQPDSTDGLGMNTLAWNDVLAPYAPGYDVQAYVVEYDVPNPGTAGLLLISALSTNLRRRRGHSR